MAGELTMAEVNAPSAGATGKHKIFLDIADSRLKVLSSAGVLRTLDERLNLGNFLRNGEWTLAQRQTPATPTTYSNTTGRSYTADGWTVTNENASVQYFRTGTTNAPESGLQAFAYGNFTKITNQGKIVVSQVIEAAETLPLRGRIARFQVLLKASASKTLKIAVAQLTSAGTANTLPATFISAFGGNGVDPTLGTNLAFVAPLAGVSGDGCTADTNSFICSVTTSWGRFGGCVTVPTNCLNIIVLVWTDTQFLANDQFSISQASLTDGYEIQDYAPVPLSVELLRCQRYYAKSFAIDTGPAQAVGLGTGEVRAITGKTTTSTGYIPIRWPVQMRAAPTVTTFSPVSANATARDITGSLDSGAVTVNRTDASGCDISFAGNASSAVGNLFGIHYTADAEI
jgi:hypothetical protein